MALEVRPSFLRPKGYDTSGTYYTSHRPVYSTLDHFKFESFDKSLILEIILKEAR